jgi:membrane protein implicated in regulation of membrane protease activity
MADYYPLIRRAVGALDKKSKEARRVLYDRARATLADQLQRVDPPLSDTDLEHERLALEDAIGKVEADAILSAQKEQILTRTFGSILLFAIILGGIVLVGMALSAPMILYLIVTLAVLLGIVWAPHVSPSLRIVAVILAALVAIGYFWPGEKASENAPQEKKQQEVENEQERKMFEAEQRKDCQAEQKRWSIVSTSQIEISDASLTGIGDSDYNISAVVKNKSESKVIGLRLSVTARACPTQDTQPADCDIFGRVETFASDIPAGEVRQINRKITIRGVGEARLVVSPSFAVNGVRAPLDQSDDAPPNDLLSGWLRGCK